jgi:hypothetical protein
MPPWVINNLDTSIELLFQCIYLIIDFILEIKKKVNPFNLWSKVL